MLRYRGVCLPVMASRISEYGYPTVYQWESTWFTMNPKELQWSSPPTTWLHQNNSLSYVGNSNHKPKSFKLNTIYLKDMFTIYMRTIINQWNQTFNNVTKCCELLTTLFRSFPEYKVKCPSMYITECHKIRVNCSQLIPS